MFKVSADFLVLISKGIEALSMAIEDATDGSVASAAAWALGHIAQHSTEHAKHVTTSGILNKILLVSCDPVF